MIHLEGLVIRGRGASKDLGYPTANIRYVPVPNVLLESGVWTSYAWVHETRYDAVAIVGVWKQPDGSPSVEVHLFGFDGDIYDTTLKVELVERFKGLTVCPNFEALKQQIAMDATEARVRLRLSS
jgi:riboflavin kinase/FMN adenylyltransferase